MQVIRPASRLCEAVGLFREHMLANNTEFQDKYANGQCDTMHLLTGNLDRGRPFLDDPGTDGCSYHSALYQRSAVAANRISQYSNNVAMQTVIMAHELGTFTPKRMVRDHSNVMSSYPKKQN